MQGVAYALLRVSALLACFVCVGGVRAAASAQSAPAADQCSARAQDSVPDSDLGSASTGSDVAEHDDDEDCERQPPILVTPQRIEREGWDCPISHASPG